MPKGVYKRTKSAWNKGLTKDTDERVKINSERRDKTKLERYGSSTFNNIDKIKNTNKSKYGCEFAFHIDKETNSIKRKQTCLEKYGVDIVSKSDDIKVKAQQTFMKNHDGYKNNFSLKEVREKINDKLKTPEVQDRKRNTCLLKYGVEYVLQSPEVLQRKIETTIDRYGTPYYANKDKEYLTKLHNGSYLKHKTKYEQEIEKLLLENYSSDDIVYQYRSEKYPFVADFYIKSTDTYIEVNGNWTHGSHPFNKDNPEDIKKLNEWTEKSKTSKYYKNAIYTWADLDVRKLNIAIQNNINLILIYKEKDNNIVYTHKKLCEEEIPITK